MRCGWRPRRCWRSISEAWRQQRRRGVKYIVYKDRDIVGCVEADNVEVSMRGDIVFVRGDGSQYQRTVVVVRVVREGLWDVVEAEDADGPTGD
jgi:hypothetical protein